jgi:molecular chaperone HscA
MLRLTQGVFEVIATGGDSALGGDDYDARWRSGCWNAPVQPAHGEDRQPCVWQPARARKP